LATVWQALREQSITFVEALVTGAGFGGLLSGVDCYPRSRDVGAKAEIFTPGSRYLPAVVALAPLLIEEAFEKRC